MKEAFTVSESKALFHSKFPHVIPALYKRVADEILVELNLLSHQTDFKPDTIFFFGITSIFYELTIGYKPNHHIDKLFDALCVSTKFDPQKIKTSYDKTLNYINGKNVNEISEILCSGIKDESSHFSSKNKYYSRIIGIGLDKLLSNATNFKELNNDEISKKIKEISESFNFSNSRIEKDISMYKGSIERMKQAIDLMEETLKAERKKRESFKKDN